MKRYHIKYQYGTYSGEVIVDAEDSESAIIKMWHQLKKHMTLPMAYKSAIVLKTETNEIQ